MSNCPFNYTANKSTKHYKFLSNIGSSSPVMKNHVLRLGCTYRKLRARFFSNLSLNQHRGYY